MRRDVAEQLVVLPQRYHQQRAKPGLVRRARYRIVQVSRFAGRNIGNMDKRRAVNETLPSPACRKRLSDQFRESGWHTSLRNQAEVFAVVGHQAAVRYAA